MTITKGHTALQEIAQLQRINKRQKSEITDLKNKYSASEEKYSILEKNLQINKKK